MPYPFSAGEILTAVNLNAAVPKRFYDDGTSATGFTSEGVIGGFTVPSQSVNGYLFVWASVFVTKSVAGDVYAVRVRLTDIAGAIQAVDQSTGGVQHTGHATCQIATTAGVALTIVVTVQVTGSGSGNVFADPSNNRTDGLWVPTT